MTDTRAHRGDISQRILSPLGDIGLGLKGVLRRCLGVRTDRIGPLLYRLGVVDALSLRHAELDGRGPEYQAARKRVSRWFAQGHKPGQHDRSLIGEAIVGAGWIGPVSDPPIQAQIDALWDGDLFLWKTRYDRWIRVSQTVTRSGQADSPDVVVVQLAQTLRPVSHDAPLQRVAYELPALAVNPGDTIHVAVDRRVWKYQERQNVGPGPDSTLEVTVRTKTYPQEWWRIPTRRTIFHGQGLTDELTVSWVTAPDAGD